MVRKQVLRARKHSRVSLLEKVKSESYQKKLTFNITYYPVFQNVKNILQDLHNLIIPDLENQKDIQDIPAVGFRNGKSLKDHLVRVKLPNVEITGRSESCGKENCQVCDFRGNTDTFTLKACAETFKTQCGILHCNSQKVVYLLKRRICCQAPYFGKAKKKFRARFKNYKSEHRPYRKTRNVSQQCFHEHYAQHSLNGINDWQFTLIEQCETCKQLKETEKFW